MNIKFIDKKTAIMDGVGIANGSLFVATRDGQQVLGMKTVFGNYIVFTDGKSVDSSSAENYPHLKFSNFRYVAIKSITVEDVS